MKKTVLFVLVALFLCSCGGLPLEEPVATLPFVVLPANSDTYEATATPFIMTPTPTEGVAFIINPPIVFPNTLDEAWDFVEDGVYGYTFDPCEPGELKTPFVTWTMALEAVAAETPDRKHPYLSIYGTDVDRIVAPGGGVFLKTDLVRVLETSVFMKLGAEYANGNIWLCGDENEKPILYGVGVQNFLDWLAVQPLAPLP